MRERDGKIYERKELVQNKRGDDLLAKDSYFGSIPFRAEPISALHL